MEPRLWKRRHSRKEEARATLFKIIILFSSLFPSKTDCTLSAQEQDWVWRVIKNFKRDYDVKLISGGNDNKNGWNLEQRFREDSWPVELLSKEGTDAFEPANCNDTSVWPRLPFIPSKRPLLLLIQGYSLEQVGQILDSMVDNTGVNCFDELKLGLLETANKFVIISEEYESLESISSSVFSRNEVKKHPSVVVLQPSGEGISSRPWLQAARFDVYGGRVEGEYHDVTGEVVPTVEELYRPFDMKGYTFRLSVMPFVFWAIADYNPNFVDPKQAFVNHSGSDLFALQTFCKILDCKIAFYNSPDFTWGDVEKGKVTGAYKDLLNDEVDIVSGCRAVSFGRYQTAIASFSHEYLMLHGVVSKAPGPVRSVFALLRPFDWVIWVLIVSFVALTPLLLTATSRAEERLDKDRKLYWSDYPNSAWYLFGTFLGQAGTDFDYEFKTWALRTFSGAWFLSAFILTASYGGNLRAFLLKPVLTDPVRTVDQLVSSGLPWNAVEYGDWAEKRITQSEDETLKVYWERKNAVPFEDFPFDRIKDVAAGNSLYVDYTSILEISIPAAYARPPSPSFAPYDSVTASTGVYMSADLLDAVLPGEMATFVSYFSKRNPWMLRFNWYLIAAEDAGLRPHWMDQQRRRLANTYRQSITPLTFVPHDNDVRMTMEQYRAVMGLYFAILGMLFLAIGWELQPKGMARLAREGRKRVGMALKKM